MEKGQMQFVLNKDKFIIAKVKIYDITETHISVQNIINNDVCPAILPIPKDKADKIIFGKYQLAKIELGAYLAKHFANTTDTDIVSAGSNFRVHLDMETVKMFIEYTKKYAPEKLI